MSFFCAISGEPPQNPVVSPKSGLIYERRLIVAQLNQHGTEPNGEPLTEDDLVPIKASPNAAPPRPPTLTSVPALLHTLQAEWDALMLETASLRQQYIATRQELSHALYQSDAATRVVARLVRERDEAREALANVRAATGLAEPVSALENANGGEDVEMAQSGGVEAEPLPEDVQQAIDETHAALSSTRKKRKAPAVPSPARLSKEPTTTVSAPAGMVGTAFALVPQISATAFATGSENGVVRVWDGGKALAELKGHEASITTLESISTSEEESYIVSGSSDTTIRLWSASAPYAQLAVDTSHTGAITGLILHPSSKLLLTCSMDGSFSLLRLPSLELISRSMPLSSAPAGGFSTAALHPDGVLLALGLAGSSKIEIYDIRSRSKAAEFDLPSGPGAAVTSLAFSENGYSLACATGEADVLVWDLRKLVMQKSLQAASPVRWVAYDKDGTYLATAGEEGVEAWAAKGWGKVWEGTGGEGGKVRWGEGEGKGSVWVGGKTGVVGWQVPAE